MPERVKTHRGFSIRRIDGVFQAEVRYQPRWIGAETSVGVVSAKRYRDVVAELDSLIEKGRIKETRALTTGGALPFHVRRDKRLALVKSRRGTEEWRADGEALAKARAEEMALQVARREARRIDDWEWASFQVPDRKVDIALDEFEGMMIDAADDLGLGVGEADAIAYDIMVAYLSCEVMTGKPTKAKVALAIRLLRHLSMDVEESIEFVWRHWTNAREVKP